jgi:hypothetical protein
MQSLTCALEALVCDAVEHGAAMVAESRCQVRESLPLVLGGRRLVETRTPNNTETFTQRQQAGVGDITGVHIVTGK